MINIVERKIAYTGFWFDVDAFSVVRSCPRGDLVRIFGVFPDQRLYCLYVQKVRYIHNM